MSKTRKLNELPVIGNLTGASIVGLDAEGNDAQFPLDSIVRSQKGIAYPATVPAGDRFAGETWIINTESYGQTFTNFGGITVPVKVGSQYVTNARFVWNAGEWKLQRELIDAPSASDLATKDDLQYKGTFDSTALAISAMPLADRKLGDTVGIKTGNDIVEWWFDGGVTDADLVEKGSKITLNEDGGATGYDLFKDLLDQKPITYESFEFGFNSKTPVLVQNDKAYDNSTGTIKDIAGTIQGAVYEFDVVDKEVLQYSFFSAAGVIAGGFKGTQKVIIDKPGGAQQYTEVYFIAPEAGKFYLNVNRNYDVSVISNVTAKTPLSYTTQEGAYMGSSGTIFNAAGRRLLSVAVEPGIQYFGYGNGTRVSGGVLFKPASGATVAVPLTPPTNQTPDRFFSFEYTPAQNGTLYVNYEDGYSLAGFSIFKFLGENVTKHFGKFLTDVDGDEIKAAVGKLPRPSNGVVHFKVEVNVAFQNVASQTLATQDSKTIMEDWGYLVLPTSYKEVGRPTRLIIAAHGTGAHITEASMGDSDMNKFWLSQGYAVMDMNGLPDGLLAPTWDATQMHYGAPVALQSYIKGYKYAVENYNLYPEVFTYGISMGGLTSFAIAQSGAVPVLAQGGFCPCIDLYKQAFSRVWNGASQRSTIATLFNFEGTRPTFTGTAPPPTAERDYFMANLSKIVGYDSMLKNAYGKTRAEVYAVNGANVVATTNPTEDAIYETVQKYHPVPLKIWHNIDDATVLFRYSKYYVQMVNNAGGLAYLRAFPSGGHNAWQNGAMVENIPTIQEGGITSIETSVYECYLWFRRFDSENLIED